MKRIGIIALTGLLVCAGLASAQSAKNPKPPKPAKKIAICHATGSSQKPYVLIRVKVKDLKGHQRHAGDIIPAPAAGCPQAAISPIQGGTELKATLTGANEVPGPGDPDGTGTASIRLLAGLGRLCYTLSVSNIVLPATGAHIHLGAAGVAGPVVVPLGNPTASSTSPTIGGSSGCVNVSRTLVGQILANPAGYYVNVHNVVYPAGAVRGQLA